MGSEFTAITEYPLMEGAVLYSTSLGGLLIGCPPEVLKTLLTKHYPMPNTVVIPGTMTRFSSSQACLEFPFYHFLFIQQGLAQGKKFRVLGKKKVLEDLKEMLRVTLLGPAYEEAMGSETQLGLKPNLSSKKVQAICDEAAHLALKGKDGSILQVEQLVEFIPLEVGEKQSVYPSVGEQPEVLIERLGEDSFRCYAGKETYTTILGAANPQVPIYPMSANPVTAQEKNSAQAFSIRLLGTSEGFDPTKPANGSLIRVDGKWYLWDCPAYLRQHLKAIGLDFSDIEGIFVSHVHEDHLDIIETIEKGKKVKIFSSPEIFHCMLLKLKANLGCSYKEAQAHYDFHPFYAGKPLKLGKAQFEVFYSVHAIPALGLKLHVEGPNGETKGLYISGDQLSKANVAKLVASKVINKPRAQEIEAFLTPDDLYDAILVDSGGGLIHGDPADYAAQPSPVYYLHTGKKLKEIPKHHHNCLPGDHIVILEA
ncbi:MAG: hypothetical protein A2508_06360 [Candidatus Lambdaproteobacteria bacterium RIFOXYD12_FULL_49_8]|uniref:Metallo-beta-lactamase domain-containing protein n=1 Tax=Candidatus Lambdaproteobacteria bacterium RIFOXYD2_FULL_50_16 TaxID=1817772 RepID=A0A1F6GB25_9PROT|nr:MAG: hypothetical protein A2527_07300 [Candidatus Lambdaproteobacteria bacterium RIFOXYD2_FULL_50_16]OGG97589.1 MAG: hypothetical protein A2508_06360 [Candidatus Lambdaproteobacteria bacterium RIFOXYD12_FULL_49_8]